MPRYFTLAEARQYLAQVAGALREGVEAKRILDAAEKENRAMVERIMFAGGMTVNHEAAIEARQKRETSAAKLKKVLESCEEIGCVIKDLDIGLLDFPALYRGKEVYLCWRLGESDIEFWHPVDEGFAGRRRIDRDFVRECGGEGK